MEQSINRKWFFQKLNESGRSLRGLAKHLGRDPSAVSRMLSGARRMKLEEASEIAGFLGVPVREVLTHAGVPVESNGSSTHLVLTAAINEKGVLEPLKEPKALPHSVALRANASVECCANGNFVATQVRASKGPLAIIDDAVVVFAHSDSVDTAAIGALSICRSHGKHVLARIERLRKTGEACVVSVEGEIRESVLEAATPVLAIIP